MSHPRKSQPKVSKLRMCKTLMYGAMSEFNNFLPFPESHSISSASKRRKGAESERGHIADQKETFVMCITPIDETLDPT